MNLREEEISKIIEHLSKQTGGFDNPKMILIGGYALRGSHHSPDTRGTAILSSRNRKAGTWTKYNRCYPRR